MVGDDQRRLIAHHEAGHTVINLALGFTVRWVEIDDVSGFTKRGPMPESVEPWADLVATLAGPCAEARFQNGPMPYGECSDYRYARQCADGLVDLGHFEHRAAAWDFGRHRAEQLVEHYWGHIERVATALQLRHRIEGAGLMPLVNTGCGSGARSRLLRSSIHSVGPSPVRIRATHRAREPWL